MDAGAGETGGNVLLDAVAPICDGRPRTNCLKSAPAFHGFGSQPSMLSQWAAKPIVAVPSLLGVFVIWYASARLPLDGPSVWMIASVTVCSLY